jgi:hypothetical protein
MAATAPLPNARDREAKRNRPPWAYEDDVHPDEWVTEFKPTPAEEADDLAAKNALRERRTTSPSTVQQSWDKLDDRTKVILAMMGLSVPEAEAAFDADLDASIAEGAARVRALRLRGLLRPKAVRPIRTGRVRGSRPRTPRRRSRGPRVSRAGPDDSEPPGLGPSPARAGRFSVEAA